MGVEAKRLTGAQQKRVDLYGNARWLFVGPEENRAAIRRRVSHKTRWDWRQRAQRIGSGWRIKDWVKR